MLSVTGRRKCREEWPSVGTERAYNLFLDGTLLLVPLIVMSLAYSLIAVKLWRGLRQEIRQTSNCQQRCKYCENDCAGETRCEFRCNCNELLFSASGYETTRNCATAYDALQPKICFESGWNFDSMRPDTWTGMRTNF